ncbi:MAG: hypothetical protein ACOC1U_06260 [Spirochaetota bacterium]
MMRHRRYRVRVLLLLFVAVGSSALAQERVGRIVEIEGFAEIDAFGQGVFITARAGDVLYESTRLRTDYDSWITATIGDSDHQVPPGSVTRVATFMNDRRRGRGVLGRLLRGIVDSLAPPSEEVADFGGRANDAATDDGFAGMFVTDVDVDDEFAAGVEALEAERYRDAVAAFRRIEYPEDGSFLTTDYYVNLTHALLGLGDVDAAMRAAFEYVRSEPGTSAVASLPSRLQLLAGISAYYAGDDAIALRAVTQYIEDAGLEDADPQAVAIRIVLLRDGDRVASRRLEREARAARPEVDWDALLDG